MLVKENIKDIYTLSPMQEGMFFHALYDKSSPAYFEQTSFRIYEELNIELVEKSLNELMKRYDVLRTVFTQKISNKILQVVLKERKIDFFYRDISSRHDKRDHVERYKKNDRENLFDLTRDVLMRIAVFRLDTDVYEFIWSFHHIIMDGWCTGILISDYFEIYYSFLENRPYSLPKTRQYRVFIDWLEKQDREYSRTYWEKYLEGYEQQAPVPRQNSSRTGNSGYLLKAHRHKSSPAITRGLNALAAGNNATVNTIFQAVWGIVLSRYNNTNDVVFGKTVSGRPPEIEDVELIVGLFINTVPVRIKYQKGMSFLALLKSILSDEVAGAPHHSYPLVEVQSESFLKQNLLDHLMTYENYPYDQQVKDVKLEFLDVQGTEQTHYDFDITVTPGEQLSIDLVYNGNIYDTGFIRRITGHIDQVFSQIIVNGEKPIGQLDLLTPEEKQDILLGFNDTASTFDRDKTFHQLFEDHAAQTPDSIAVVGELHDAALHTGQNPRLCAVTYKELNQNSWQLAGCLGQKGVNHDTIVGILMERSIEMIAGILGIMKANGAYLPITPDSPGDRLNYILADSNTGVLVTDSRFYRENEEIRRAVDGRGLEIVFTDFIDNLDLPVGPPASPPPPLRAAPASLAYVIYTSGTTGNPKGVTVQHGNLVNAAYAWQDEYKLNQMEVNLLQLASFTFDVFAGDIARAFTCGGKLVICPAELRIDPELLHRLITRQKITLFESTPSLILPFLDYLYENGKSLETMRLLIIGSDILPVEDFKKTLSRFGRKDLRIINSYGVTEATIDSSYYEGSAQNIPANGNVPIGKPMPNMKLLVSDIPGMLTPVGIAGELYIGGSGVARGYLNNPELTAETFIENQNLFQDHSSGSRLYRTGDLARWQPDGNVDFLGRKDNQVKIRGFRIEPGEIEDRLLKHVKVKEAVVVAREDKTGDKYLCGYVVPDPAAGAGEKNRLVSMLKKDLSHSLPNYMIPSQFIILDAIPLTPNGKVDRNALPAPEFGIDGTHTPPRDQAEEKLAAIWAEILGMDKEKIGIDSNFFDLGGHSLKATIMVARVHSELSVKIALSDIFKNPTINGLSSRIKGDEKDTAESIRPVETKEFYAASSAQKRMYLLQQLDQDSTAYNLFSIMALDADIDTDRIETAVRELIKRHESFRTSFLVVDDEPVQIIHENVEFTLDFFDATGKNTVSSYYGKQIVNRICKTFIRPFDLFKAPLIRVGLIKLEVAKHLLIMDAHHIITDGFSDGIIAGDFVSLYTGNELHPLKLQYRDFSEWENRAYKAGKLKQQEEFWLIELSGELPVLNLPTDYPRPEIQSFEGDTVQFELAPRELDELNKLARDSGATLYMVLLAIASVLLAKLSGQDDLVIGTPVAGRRHADLQQIIGMFVNTMALRNYPRGELTFEQFLGDIKKRTLKSFENQDYPFDKLVSQLVPRKDPSRNPLFDVMFVLQNVNYPGMKIPGLTLSPYEYDIKVTKFDLMLNAIETDEQLSLSFDYSTKLFKKATIKRFVSFFREIFSAVSENKKRRISGLEIIPEHEKQQVLYDFNDTNAGYPKDKTIHQLFEEQAGRCSGRCVAVSGRQHITYGELNERANRLTQELQEKGVGPETIVAILENRSIEMVTGILAILKAGGAYLPIAPDYPQERIDYMKTDSNARLLLTPGDIPAASQEPPAHRTPNPAANKSVPTNLAYIIYTSGTTGRPKGTMIEHRNVVRLMVNDKFQFDVSEADTWSVFHSFCFDFSIWEMYGALLYGGKMVIVSRQDARDTDRFLDILQEEKVTMLSQTPSAFNNLSELASGKTRKPNMHIRYVVFGGEALKPSKLAKWYEMYPQTRLINMYGITETTVHVTFKEIDQRDIRENSGSIGKPIPTLTAYVMDRHNNLLPPGVPGECCVGGKGVSRGYLNRPVLTSEKFIWNPFKPGEILYRSGDLVKMTGNGELHYLGRIDQQVKIRGFRIELGEIESQLLKRDEVKEAVVLARETGGGEKYLCAYIATDSADTDEIRDFLSRKLPDYMVPAFFVKLDKIPLTSSGKADKKSLPDPQKMSMDNDEQYVAPQNAMEKKVAEICQIVLGIKSLGAGKDFFEVGADSIKIIQIVARMNREGLKVEMGDILRNPSIASLAPLVREIGRTADQSVISGPTPLTPIQQWFFENHTTAPHHFNQAVMIYSGNGFDEEPIKNVFSKIQTHHDALRMTYKWEDGKIIQTNHGLDHPLSLEVWDLRDQKDAMEALEVKANNIHAGIHLEKGPLIKLGLFRMSDGDRLLIVSHHLVIDGISWRILLEDIESLYHQYIKGEPLNLPLKTDPFMTWAEKLSQYANSKPFLHEKTYWAQLESRAVSVPGIPKDFEAGTLETDALAGISFSLDKEETGLLLSKANEAFGTEINDLLLTALGLSFKKLFNNRQLLIALEGHGREEIIKGLDISRTIGWFTSLYPVLLDIMYEDNLARQIIEVKENLRKIPAKGIGYGILKYLTDAEYKEEVQFKSKPQIVFNYFGQFNEATGGGSFEISDYSPGDNVSKNAQTEFEFEVTGIILKDRLEITTTYNKNQYKAETAQAICDHYKSDLREIISYCATRESRRQTPSDLTYKEMTIEFLEQLQRDYNDSIEDIYPLTPMQEGMLFYSLVDEESTAYFEQMSFDWDGELEITLAEKSMNLLFSRFDVLRTAFIYQGIDRPLQVVLGDRPAEFYYEDISELSGREQHEFTENFKEEDLRRPFDLSRDVLMRITVIRLDESFYKCIWSFHHILMDGWSLSLLISDFLEIYNNLLTGGGGKLRAIEPYRTYLQWLEGRDREESKNYWNNYLEDFHDSTYIGSIRSSHTTGTQYNPENISATISSQETRMLNKLTGKNHVTLNTLMRTVWGLLLAKYTRTQDVVFGAVVSGRPTGIIGIEQMVGLFINTIPVRITFREDQTFRELLHTIQKEAIDSESHHYFPLATIQAERAPGQDLFDHIFVFENYPIGEQIETLVGHKNNEGIRVTGVELLEQTNYNFNLSLVPGKELNIVINYNANEYYKDIVRQIVTHFMILLKQILADDRLKIGRITILSEEEKNRILYDFNNPGKEYGGANVIHHRFEEQSLKTPDRIAVVGSAFPGTEDEKTIQLSYKELNRYSNHLAYFLREQGVRPGSIVPVLLEPSVELPIAIMAILKIGCGYLPIDPGYPIGRIKFILEDADVKVLLRSRNHSAGGAKLQEMDIINACYPEGNPISHEEEQAPFSNHPGTNPTDLAYAIYTSGSTGIPKGVLVEHQSVVNLLASMQERYPITGSDVYLFKTSYVFDVSVSELFGWFMGGGKLSILAREDSKIPGNIIASIERDAVTHINFVPSIFNPFLDELKTVGTNRLSSLKYIFLAGEALLPRLVEKYNDICKDICKNMTAVLDNLYGPTEGTVYSSWYSTSQWTGLEAISIGKPLPNVTVHIVDLENRLQPVGIPGELCIAGAGVARGYMNRPELTAKHFVFTAHSHHPLMTYKTGDLARWLPDGNIEFLGRIDQQIKIRGFRIELGEIESRLLGHESVKEAVVIDRQIASQSAVNRLELTLCAYVIPHEDRLTEDKSSLFSLARDLRKHLTAALPDYMIPSYFMWIEQIPLHPSGKVNRDALPDPAISGVGTYTAPRDKKENVMVEIWSETLGLAKSVIGIDNRFVDLGGHSINAIILAGKIHKELNVKIPLPEFFKRQTIRGLSEYMKALRSCAYIPIDIIENREYYPMSSAQSRIYIAQQSNEESTGYNMLSLFEVEGNLDIDKFQQVFTGLIKRHESLRTGFETINGAPSQKIYTGVPFKIQFYEETLNAGDNRRDEKIESIAKNFSSPFNLARAPLFRVGLIKTGPMNYILMVDIHHIISDGVSMDIFTREFLAIYAGENLPAIKFQYKDYSVWQQKQKEKGAMKDQEEYWLKKFSGDIPVLEIPTDFPRPVTRDLKGRKITFEINRELTSVIRSLVQESETTLYIFLLTVYYIQLSIYTGQEDILVGSPITGRRHPDLQAIIGMFVNMLVLRNQCKKNSTFLQFLEEVKSNILDAFENQDYQFEELVETLEIKSEKGRNPLFDVVFQIQNFSDDNIETAPFLKDYPLEIVPYESDECGAPFDLILIAIEHTDVIEMSLVYATALFNPSTAVEISNQYIDILEQVAENKNIEIAGIEISHEALSPLSVNMVDEGDFNFL